MTQEVRTEEEEVRWSGWMRASQTGDAEAFEKLLRQLLPRIRSQVFGRLAGRDHAEDVVQNVLLSIHRSRHTYHSSRPFKPWLNAVVRNAVIDSARARRNEWRSQPFDDFEIASDEPLPGMQSGQLSPELIAALARLPESQREAVELLHLQDLSLDEAARRAGTTPGAFKVRAHRGRLRLRAILETNEQERGS